MRSWEVCACVVGRRACGRGACSSVPEGGCRGCLGDRASHALRICPADVTASAPGPSSTDAEKLSGASTDAGKLFGASTDAGKCHGCSGAPLHPCLLPACVVWGLQFPCMRGPGGCGFPASVLRGRRFACTLSSGGLRPSCIRRPGYAVSTTGSRLTRPGRRPVITAQGSPIRRARPRHQYLDGHQSLPAATGRPAPRGG